MMSLRTRITLFVCLCILILGAGVTLAGLKREELISRRYVEASLKHQQGAWARVEERLTQDLQAVTMPELASKQVSDAIDQHDQAKLAGLIWPAFTRLRDAARVGWLDITDTNGSLLYSSRQGLATQPLVDPAIIEQAVEKGVVTGGVQQEMEEGRFLATVVRAIKSGDRVVGAAVLGRDIEAVFDELNASLGGEVFIVDTRGNMVYGADKHLWADLAGRLADMAGESAVVSAGDQVFSATSLSLTNTTGVRLGRQIALTDITASFRQETFLRRLAFAGIACFVLVVVVVLSRYLQQSFRPLDAALSALNALSHGDVWVEVEGHGRNDEVGRIASAIDVFRRQQNDVRHLTKHQERLRLRQQRFIRRQMLQLAETLEDQARQETLRDLERIEQAARDDELGGLAAVLQVMAQRVREQHRHLDQLIAELREALKTKTELLNLQQQFEIARKMQLAILPRGFPPREDMEIYGRLLQAETFGGDFYDYFLLDSGRVAVAAGQISGQGLAGAFFALIARTLVKAITSTSVSPAAALVRINNMLASDNDQELKLGLFLGILDPASASFSFSGGCYPPPHLITRLGEATALPVDEEAPPIGVTHELQFVDRTVSLPRNSTVVMCSSGVEQTANSAGGVFSRAALVALLKSADDLRAASLVRLVVEALSDFTDDRPRDKDASCVAFRLLGE
jgi:sigma-B regulation protein RsbU (phosphoserine phosphatase)